MEDWIIPLLVVVFISGLVAFTVSGSSFITTQTQLQEASQSAQIKTVCEQNYKNTSYKDVPIKCLEFWGFTKK